MLNKMIRHYIELHQAMGFKYRIQNCLLQHYAAFAKKQGDNYVRCKTVLEWANQAPSQAQKRNRLLTVRRFAIKMQSDDPRYEIPPADVFGRDTFKRKIRHILSTSELKQLLIAASKLKPQNSIRPITYVNLFALLAATGLRVSEAIRLNIQDITDDGLIIRSTKFKKDRIVPLHKSAQEAIKRYLKIRLSYVGDDALFISINRKRVSYSTINSIFLQLVRSTGLRQGPGHSGVCIHDLRHRFAVKSLEKCGGDRKAIANHMISLSTYLGHAHISDTYWYLQATPILMKKIAIIQEAYFRRIPND